MTFAPRFAVLLRGFRRDAALTQEALAARAELSVEAIRLLEAGRRRHPRRATVRQLAEALGLSEQDGARLLEAAGRRPAVTGHELPPDVDDFSGRTAELGELLDALTGTAPAVALVSVAGMGGIGKTALAVHGARLLTGTFPDGVIYLNLGAHGGGEPAQPLELLQRLLRTLGVDEGQIPAEVEVAAARYRSVLAGRRVLVLLDDAASAAQVGPLIPGQSGSAVLITSRKQLTEPAGLRQLRLDVLPDAEALELLSALLGERKVEEEREAALAVARLCGHLPLALRIAAGYLSGQQDKSVGQLAAELEDSRTRVLSTDGNGVRASVDLSLRALADDAGPIARTAAETFPIAALLGADDFALDAAAAAMDRPAGEIEDALEHLVDISLLETPQPHRYRMHDLVAEVGRELAHATLGTAGIETVRLRVLDRYLALVWRIDEHAAPREALGDWPDPEWSSAAKHLDLEAAIELLDADRQNLVATVRAAAGGSSAQRRAVIRIATGMNNYGLSRKRWSEWRAVLGAAVTVAGELDDPVAAGMVHFDLGIVHNELDDFEAGAGQLARAVGYAHQIAVESFEAAAKLHLSHALERADRPAEARAIVEQVQKQQLDEQIASWIALILGMIAGKEKDLPGQRAAFDRSIELYRVAGAPARALAMRYRTIGESLAEAGEYEEAEAAFHQALALYRGENDAMDIAAILECLGTAYVGSRRFDQAESVLLEALPLVQEQQQWDCEARIQVALGRRLAALGRIGEAEDAWRQALGIYERHGAAAAEDVRELLA
ncbi:NB-ARC domain-containing protein [Kribbella sp. NPDC051620]|uniref:NB-ARC domain-containing protein n=1 Tax=Kribbella sp. NPDC051620 TaxID=3364120 RepID=UPI0037BB7F2C